jgi:hypothetical protein
VEERVHLEHGLIATGELDPILFVEEGDAFLSVAPDDVLDEVGGEVGEAEEGAEELNDGVGEEDSLSLYR